MVVGVLCFRINRFIEPLFFGGTYDLSIGFSGRGYAARLLLAPMFYFGQTAGCAMCPYCLLLLHSPPPFQLDRKVRDFWDEAHGWDFDCLRAWLPPAVLSDFHGIRLPEVVSSQLDVPLWVPGVDDRFSLFSTKNLIRPPRSLSPLLIWRQLWRFKGPTRASLTLWATARDVLPTRSLLWRRHIAPDAACCWCVALNQTSLHLLRDCPSTVAVWRLLVPSSCWSTFFSDTDCP